MVTRSPQEASEVEMVTVRLSQVHPTLIREAADRLLADHAITPEERVTIELFGPIQDPELVVSDAKAKTVLERQKFPQGSWIVFSGGKERL